MSTRMRLVTSLRHPKLEIFKLVSHDSVHLELIVNKHKIASFAKRTSLTTAICIGEECYGLAESGQPSTHGAVALIIKALKHEGDVVEGKVQP